MNGIEQDLEDQADVLRLSVTDDVGRQLAVRYVVQQVPTLVVLDGGGNVVLRQSGRLSRAEVVQAVEDLAG